LDWAFSQFLARRQAFFIRRRSQGRPSLTDKTGGTELTGLFVARRDDPARTIAT